tara:strand:+ start:2687 stop:2884 length:198 start_codon:yes stop_codon:yes gene_type:complete
MSREELENIVAFSVLMESGDGIINKAPKYIEEKFKACLRGKRPFDEYNEAIYNFYFRKWDSPKEK